MRTHHDISPSIFGPVHYDFQDHQGHHKRHLHTSQGETVWKNEEGYTVICPHCGNRNCACGKNVPAVGSTIEVLLRGKVIRHNPAGTAFYLGTGHGHEGNNVIYPESEHVVSVKHIRPEVRENEVWRTVGGKLYITVQGNGIIRFTPGAWTPESFFRMAPDAVKVYIG